MKKPRLIIFASGSKTGGGSGFENLVNASRAGVLDTDIVAVVSNYENGGVREKADRLGVPFIYFPKPWTARRYEKIVGNADFVALSGWLKIVRVRKVGFFYSILRLFGLNNGLDPRKTFNIHPAPLPEFGGVGMYGHYAHEAVMQAYLRGEITHSAVSMHFVTKKYDEGPVFLSVPVEIFPDDTPETLAKRVNVAEHQYQPVATNDVVHGRISWDGVDPTSLKIIR